MIMLADNGIKDIYDLVVIGGGPAGLAAALSAKDRGLKDVLVLERQPGLGGILTQCIHNGFGSVLFKKDMPGPMYAEKFIEKVAQTDISVLTDTMVLDLTSDLEIYATNNKLGYLKIKARSVVLAMGCRERTRAQIKLPGARPAGVFSAGTVQRFVNVDGYMPGKEFVILGSGDIGMIMARRLTLEGAKVKAVLELLPFLTGLRRNYVQCLQDFDIPLLLSTTVKRIVGSNRVEAIESVKVDESLDPIAGTEELISCDTLMLSVGLIPENELSRGAGVVIDSATGGPVVDENMATNVPGIFAAGNVVTIYDLVDYVSQAGEIAGASAAAYVDKNDSVGDFVKIEAGANVRSLIPQQIRISTAGDKIGFKFRVSRLIENKVTIELRDESGNVLKTVKKRYARPAEMFIVDVPKNDIFAGSGNAPLKLTVSVLENS